MNCAIIQSIQSDPSTKTANPGIDKHATTLTLLSYCAMLANNKS